MKRNERTGEVRLIEMGSHASRHERTSRIGSAARTSTLQVTSTCAICYCWGVLFGVEGVLQSHSSVGMLLYGSQGHWFCLSCISS
jgi:hypothetical protein